MPNPLSSDGYTRKAEVPEFLCRKEFAYFCKVSLSTVDRGIRDRRWLFNAFIRVSPRRILYPASLLQEIKQEAEILKSAEKGRPDTKENTNGKGGAYVSMS